MDDQIAGFLELGAAVDEWARERGGASSCAAAVQLQLLQQALGEDCAPLASGKEHTVILKSRSHREKRGRSSIDSSSGASRCASESEARVRRKPRLAKQRK